MEHPSLIVGRKVAQGSGVETEFTVATELQCILGYLQKNMQNVLFITCLKNPVLQTDICSENLIGV